jgi:cell wall assembly regulator SMI1
LTKISSRGLVSRPGSASLLPTHMDSLHTPLSRYPPLSTTWNRLRSWLNREYPELGDTLNYGILPQDLADVEMQFGFPLPPAIRESYLIVNGQEAESAAACAEGLFFGLTFLPLESVLEEWRFWREVDDDPATGANPKLLELMQSIPPGWIRADYSNRGWVPLIADKAGNYIGIDLNPGQKGSIGQVIIFGRDFDTKVVLWGGDGPGGWAKWLAAFAEELEAGEGFEIGSNENTEGDEDDIGYESYYHDGSGRGAGDGGGSASTGGGLRLTGEYRGWSVMEAWGDRSLRKWHEAGLLPEYLQSGDTPVTSKVSTRHHLLRLLLTLCSHPIVLALVWWISPTVPVQRLPSPSSRITSRFPLPLQSPKCTSPPLRNPRSPAHMHQACRSRKPLPHAPWTFPLLMNSMPPKVSFTPALKMILNLAVIMR